MQPDQSAFVIENDPEDEPKAAKYDRFCLDVYQNLSRVRSHSVFETNPEGCELKRLSFWENRYKVNPARYEWIQPYICQSNRSALARKLKRLLELDDKILIIGCGSSSLATDMIEDEFEDITCVDWSENAIDAQNEYINKPLDDNGDGMPRASPDVFSSIKFLCMDAKDMSAFADSSFDCVIDKGMVDVLMSAADPRGGDCLSVLSEVHRVLIPTGKFICLSEGKQAQRKKHLKKFGKFQWRV